MSSVEELQAAIDHAQELVTQQGDTVRRLKADVKTGNATKVLKIFSFGLSESVPMMEILIWIGRPRGLIYMIMSVVLYHTPIFAHAAYYVE